MFWWILIGVSAFLCILGATIAICIYKYAQYAHDGISLTSIVVSVLFGIVFIVTVIVVPVEKVKYDQEIEVFKQQKYYIEKVVPTLPDTDNFALTQKRIELNEWLYKAQYKVKNRGFFTLYSNEVLELEEIK